jgi:hypothetical protein
LPFELVLAGPGLCQETKLVKSPAAGAQQYSTSNDLENKMESKQRTPVRRIFRQLDIRFEDLEHFSELLSDVQTCLSVSVRENFSHLPARTDPQYGGRVRDGILSHLNFLCNRMEGLVDELTGLIGQARQDEGWVAYHDVEFISEGNLGHLLINPRPVASRLLSEG